MKTVINYFISENYIPHWNIEDAYREIYQNFIDYGEYNVEITNKDEKSDLVILSNSFNPINTDFLIIGESNKSGNQLGKWGEGLKMAALVLLRHEGQCIIHTSKFKATFVLITNETTDIKTLGVEIIEYAVIIEQHTGASFCVELLSPVNTFKNYGKNIIKAVDVLHTRDGYGSIVHKPKGNFYVGGLFVTKIAKLNYAYDIYPRNVNLDRDRKIPSDWDVKYNISKIQETYEEFDKVGKSADVLHSTIPEKYIGTYKPKTIGDKVVFTTKVTNEEGKEEEVEVSDNFANQLRQHSYFSKIVFKLKKLITSSLGIKDLALAFRNKYCFSEDSIRDFNILMYRFGIELDPVEEVDDKPF